MTTATTPTTPSTLASLRRLIPRRACTPAEARAVAEAQATRLAHLMGCDAEGIQTADIEALPRISVTYEALPVSGLSHWNGQRWIICLNSGDSPARQRFTLLHEFKHIIDHGSTDWLYPNPPRRPASFRGRSAASGFTPEVSGRASPSSRLAEQAADYFAGCALMPKRELKRAWGNGLQRPDDLAAHFGVSVSAMEVRLDQTGLSREIDPEPTPRQARCARPVSTPRWQAHRFRTATPGYPRRSLA